MKNLGDEVVHTAVVILVAAVLLHLAWTTVRPLLWLVVFLIVVLVFVKFHRR